MSFPSDVFDDEMSLLDLLNFPGSPEICIPLTEESTGMIYVSPMNEANPLMSFQQSNGRTYQERSTVPNPLEMIMQQEQLGNSHEMWLQPPPSALARGQDDLHNLRMVNISDLTYPIQNHVNRIPNLNVVLENNNSFIPRPQMPSNSIRPQMLSNFTSVNVVPENNISFIPRPQMTPNSIRPQMASSFTRISNLNGVPENNISCISMPQMAPNSIRPQMASSFTRISNLNGVPENNISCISMPQMAPNSSRPQMAMNSIMPQMASNFTRIPTLNIVPENNISFIPRPQMPPNYIRPQMFSNFTRIPNLNVVRENNISFIPRPQMPPNSIRPQMSSNSIRILNLNVVRENNISFIPRPQLPQNSIRPQMSSNSIRIPNLNVVRENNISFIPRPQLPPNSIRPQMSSNSIRHHGNMQRSVNQSLLRFRFSTQIRPSANSTIPLPSEVVGSRRRSYQSRFDFGQSSSPVQRRRISTDENVASTSINPAEPRLINRVYNPLYESLGIDIDPHLRKFSYMKE